MKIEVSEEGRLEAGLKAIVAQGLEEVATEFGWGPEGRIADQGAEPTAEPASDGDGDWEADWG